MIDLSTIDPFWVLVGCTALAIGGPLIASGLITLWDKFSTALNDYNIQMAEALAKNHVQHDRYEPELMTFLNRRVYKRVWKMEMAKRNSAVDAHRS